MQFQKKLILYCCIVSRILLQRISPPPFFSEPQICKDGLLTDHAIIVCICSSMTGNNIRWTSSWESFGWMVSTLVFWTWGTSSDRTLADFFYGYVFFMINTDLERQLQWAVTVGISCKNSTPQLLTYALTIGQKNTAFRNCGWLCCKYNSHNSLWPRIWLVNYWSCPILV